jgi:hypothetical protein
MNKQALTNKFKEWLWHYAQAELFGTITALAFALLAYCHTHSYAAGAGAGFVGEGIGFYGYFLVSELRRHGLHYRGVPFYKNLPEIMARSSGNLFVEFAPAEIFDDIFVRPLAMFIVPQHVKPYALGFVAGKFGSDLVFYILAIAGYELKKRWHKI